MDNVTRRRFVGIAGLAATALSRTAFCQEREANGAQRAGTPRATSRARDFTDAQLQAMFERCSNTGRWYFLLTTAPMRMPGGTSSPVNPLCAF